MYQQQYVTIKIFIKIDKYIQCKKSIISKCKKFKEQRPSGWVVEILLQRFNIHSAIKSYVPNKPNFFPQ